MRVLIPGGAGYVGSHVARECLRAGHEPVIFDSYVTGHRRAVDGLLQFPGDLRDAGSIRSVLEKFQFDAVLHLALRKSLPETAKGPSAYLQSNISGTINLLRGMVATGVDRLILSSGAAVYGAPDEIPIEESHATRPVAPLGRSLLQVERLVTEFAAGHDLRYAILRVFHVAGADPCGDIGESHESRLVPRLLLTALSRFDSFQIFGAAHDTPDGTCVRDLVHVNDVARAHVLALEALDGRGGETVNIGSEDGHSIRQVVEEARRILGLSIPVTIARHRRGDPGQQIASNRKARNILGWRPEHDLEMILRSAWTWHRTHPRGYRPESEND